MKQRFFGLQLAALAALLAAAPAVAFERVERILAEQRQNGYRSPAAAIERLQAASDVPGADAPLDARRRYQAALAQFSLKSRQPELNAAALGKLEAMAAGEDCRTCGAQALIVRAHGALDRRQTQEALDYVVRARPLVDPANQDLGLELSYVEVRLQDALTHLTQAMAIALPAAKLAEKTGNASSQVRLMTLMVGINADLGNLERAQALAVEALAMAEPMGFDNATGTLLLLQGYVHALAGEREGQLRALNAALAIAEGDPGLVEVEITSRSNLSDYFLSTGEFAAAERHASEAAALARSVGDAQSLGLATANQGIAMVGLGDVPGGIAALERAIALVTKIGHKVLEIAITQELVKVLEAGGRYREALQAMQRITEISAEITVQERDKAVMELQATYDAERKDREIERLSAQNQLRAAEVTARTWQQRLWAALALALALAAISLVQWLTRARRANKRLAVDNHALAEQSVHDPLTGAYNRRHFQTLMAQQQAALVARSHEPGAVAPVGLMMLDVDHFKRVNDRFGHAAGDAVLVAICQRLQQLVRQHDAVVRWGGEEFVLVLPGASPEGLAQLAERVLRLIGEDPVVTGGHLVPVTISIGCVTYPIFAGQQWEDALHVADLALYQSKAGGRNRATCVLGISADARMDRVRSDLAAAQAAGDIELRTVAGPAPVNAAVAGPSGLAAPATEPVVT